MDISRYTLGIALGFFSLISTQGFAAPGGCDASGNCPGLARAAYLAKTNLLDPNANISGRAIFKDAKIGTCATVTDQQTSFRSFQNYETASELTEALNLGVDAKAGFPVKVTNVDATLSATHGHTSVETQSFNSTVLNIRFVNKIIGFDLTSQCLSPDNLEPTFVASFESLALPLPEQVGSSATWASYAQFLQNWGSHFQVQQEVGSLVQQWVSSQSSSIQTTDTLKAKACFNLEGLPASGAGWSASPCGSIDAQRRLDASKLSTTDKRYIAGGTLAARSALIQQFNETNLSNFIASAGQGDQAIGFKYVPLWSVLQEVYRIPCGQGGKDSAACKNLQRAVTLQAAYEGFTAYSCSKQVDGNSAPIQTMRVEGPDSLGIFYFACHQSKTGCREERDCVVKPALASFQCYCEGPGCIDSALIPGTTDTYRNFVRGQTDYDYLNSNKGVNDSCKDQLLGCDCDQGWAGGKPARDVWDQALSNVGSSLQSAMALSTGMPVTKAATASITDPAAYKLHVTVETQSVLTKAEAEAAQKAADYARAQGDVRHARVISTPAGIDCPGVCDADFPKNTKITLQYEENLDHKFVNWLGAACSSKTHRVTTKSKSCVIQSLDEEMRVNAIFKVAR